MRRLGRISIFSTAIHKFLKNIKRHYHFLYDTIDDSLTQRYLTEKALACFAMVKPSQSPKTLEQVSSDLYGLIQRFQNHEDIASMHSFKLLQRILAEQCQIEESGELIRAVAKECKQIASDSLQNPSDPDAAFSGHKGQGYQVQIMETYTDTADKDEKAKTLNLITHVEVQRAHQSDANALIPAIESAQKKGLCPKQLLADSLYGSDQNVETAASKGVEVISPPMGSEKRGAIGLSDFHIEKSGKVIGCPQGHAPIHSKRKRARYCAGFNPDHCKGCPNQRICPAQPGKKAFYLRFTDKQLRIALRRSATDSDEFKDRYRWRAGVEATMSEFDRRTGVKKLRVRGFKAVRYYAILKALGLNILRAAAVMAAIFAGTQAPKRGKGRYRVRFNFFKEQFWIILALFDRLFTGSSKVLNISSKLCFR
ncbi:MAG: transposase [Desulfobacteraceae bacterium]|nr:transposase [Desulfobacteraceae bacterium]